MQRVEVTWRDSMGDPEWRSLTSIRKDAGEPGYLDCRSVGYLVRDKPDSITIAMNLNAHDFASDSITIPREAVTGIWTLRR